MTKRELGTEFQEKWKKESSNKYMMMLACDAGEIVSVVIALLQLPGGLDDKKVTIMAIWLVVSCALGFISKTIKKEQKKDWEAYLEKNQDRLE